jgi:hypothetical protein
MGKEVNIGSMKLSLPDYNSDVGRAIEQLQNDYEGGNVRALFAIYATKTTIRPIIAGDGMVIPFTAMAASAVSGAVLESVEDQILGVEDGTGDDDDD